jgi:thioredoxin 2
LDGKPLTLTQDNFAKHLGKSDIPLLVDFWAPWCGPCKMMAPAFAQAAQMLSPKVRLAKVDTEQEPGLAQSFGIKAIPTMILFRGGQEAARTSGAMSAPDIARWASSVL